jgi:hypothetical protein
MAEFSAFESEKISWYTFVFKSQKQKDIKPVIRHLPPITPAEEICEALTNMALT